MPYLIKQPDGGIIGPVNHETVKDLVASGRVGSDSRIKLPGGAFVPIGTLNEFSGLIPLHQRAKLPATYSGYFSELSFFRVFFRLFLAKETGRLVISRPANQSKDIYLEQGIPVFAGSNIPEERIGEYLVASDAISRNQLEDALTIVGEFGNHLGHTLMTMNVISPHEFYQHLVQQLREKIKAAAGWEDGRYDFFQGVKYDGPKIPVELDPLSIMVEGRSRIKRSTLDKKLERFMDQPLKFVPELKSKLALLKLGGSEMKVIQAASRGTLLRQMVIDFAGDDQGGEVLSLIYMLIEFGFIA